MKKFDVESIKNRLVGKIQDSIKENNTNNGLEEIALVYEDSLIQALFSATAEVESEMVRYAEYLLKEKKWNKATNLSSIVSQANYISYKPHRKSSSFGTVYFSTDPKIESLPLSVLDSSQGETLRGDISKGDIVVDNKNNEFIVTEILEEDSSESNIYVAAKVLQGIQKVQYSIAIGKPGEYIEINNDSVEDADTKTSKALFKVFVKSLEIGNWVEWTKVDSLLAVGTAYAEAYQIVNAPDFSKVFVVFGNGKAGKKLTEGSSVRIEYVETTGLSGNVFTKNKITKIKSLRNNKKLYCSNKSRVAGGTEYDSIDKIKEVAPLEYLKFYTIGNVQSYYENILKIKPDISKLKVFGGSKEENGISQKIIYITALDGAGNDLYELNKASGRVIREIVTELADLKNPSDMLEFYPITFIPIKIGASVFINDNPKDSVDKIQTDLERALFIKYNKHAREFQENFYYSDLIALLHENENVDYVKVQVSAIEAMTLNNFSIFDYYNTSEYFMNETLTNNINFVEQAIRFDFKFNNIFKESEFPGFTEKSNETGDFLLMISIIARDSVNDFKSRTLFYDPTFKEDSLFIYGFRKEWAEIQTYNVNLLFHSYVKVDDYNYTITIEEEDTPITINLNRTLHPLDFAKFEKMVDDASFFNELDNKYIANVNIADIIELSYESFELNEVEKGGTRYQTYLMTAIDPSAKTVLYNYEDTINFDEGGTFDEFWSSYHKEIGINLDSEIEIPATATMIEVLLKTGETVLIHKPHEISSFIKLWDSRRIKQFPKVNFNLTNSTWNSRIMQPSVAPYQLKRYKVDTNDYYIKKVPLLVEDESQGAIKSYEQRFNPEYEYPVKNTIENVRAGGSNYDSLGDNLDNKLFVDGIKLKFNNDYNSNIDTLFSGRLELPLVAFDVNGVIQDSNNPKEAFLEIYSLNISAVPKNKNIIGIGPETLIHSGYSNKDSDSLIKVDVLYE